MRPSGRRVLAGEDSAQLLVTWRPAAGCPVLLKSWDGRVVHSRGLGGG